MDGFEPRLDILPAAQRRLWPELRAVPDGFVLYGGTAVALWLGHRVSVDFDFMAEHAFDPHELAESLPLLARARAPPWAGESHALQLHPRKPFA